MTTLTIRLPEDTSLRLKQLAASRGMSLNKLMEELGTAALAAHDTETRFRVLAGGGRSAGGVGRARSVGRHGSYDFTVAGVSPLRQRSG
jgi:hypothetical protein